MQALSFRDYLKLTLVPLIVVYTRLLSFGKNFRGSTFIRVYMFITWDRIFTLYMFIRDMLILLSHFSMQLVNKPLNLALMCLKCGQNEGKYSQ